MPWGIDALHPETFELVLPDRTRVALRGTTMIGRGPGSTVRSDDRTVSRSHARIDVGKNGIVLADVGSSHGTWVDGRRVRDPVTLVDGSRVRVGDWELVVERRRRDSEAGLTVVEPASGRAASADDRPRLRPGVVRKRLEASEGPRRWVLRDPGTERFVRLDDADGRLLELIDGRRSVFDLMSEAQLRGDGDGGARMARLLAELADRGLIDGPGRSDGGLAVVPPGGRLRRAVTPREWVLPGAARRLDELSAHGGWRLFTPPALAALAAVAVAGLIAFVYLVAGRYGTPFVVASKVGIGGLVFMLGRLLLAAVHETAHGLAMASFGRHVGRAGIKLVLVFPYAFVDTSEAWLEPRRRRIAVSAAGPASDLVLSGAFSLVCLSLGRGVVRDVCFQVAFGGYLGALANLNPFVERDGYHVLADMLREPRLRRRAREELAQRIRGEATGPASPMLVRYALGGIAWSVVAAGAAIFVSLRYAPALKAVLPGPVVDVLLAAAWLAVMLPAVLAVAGPLRERARGRGR